MARYKHFTGFVLVMITATLAFMAAGCSDGISKEESEKIANNAAASAVANMPTQAPGVSLDQIKSAVADEVKKNLPTPVPTPKPLTEEQVRAIAKEEAQKAAALVGKDKTYSEVQAMIEKAVTDAVTAYKQKPNLNEVELRALIGDAFKLKAAATPSASATASASGLKITGNADVRKQVDTFKVGNWTVTTYEGVTPQMVNWFKGMKDLDPANWPTFPNVDNPKVGFKAANGLYYGLDERNYCDNDICDVLVQARGYNNITGDYDLGFVAHKAADDKLGSALLLINVGEVTANFEDVHVDNGFSVAERYFNGDELQQAIWGVTSHTTAAMLNFPVIADATTGRVLNAGGSDVNAGANCSVVAGCNGVHYTVVITSGNQILVVAKTGYSK